MRFEETNRDLSPEDVIGEPAARAVAYSDAEIGWMMKIKARAMIDAGEIKDESAAAEYVTARMKWIAEMEYLRDDTRLYWLKFEQAFLRSARKYLAEIREIESSFK